MQNLPKLQFNSQLNNPDKIEQRVTRRGRPRKIDVDPISLDEVQKKKEAKAQAKALLKMQKE